MCFADLFLNEVLNYKFRTFGTVGFEPRLLCLKYKSSTPKPQKKQWGYLFSGFDLVLY